MRKEEGKRKAGEWSYNKKEKTFRKARRTQAFLMDFDSFLFLIYLLTYIYYIFMCINEVLHKCDL